MVSSLLSVVVAMVLGGDPAGQGLPFGIPPAPDDPVIQRIAPPQCLFYINWAGTAAPSSSSASETEKLLAEPEVQELLRAVSRSFDGMIEHQMKSTGGSAALDATLQCSAADALEIYSVTLMHPTAVFLTDLSIKPAKSAADAKPKDENTKPKVKAKPADAKSSAAVAKAAPATVAKVEKTKPTPATVAPVASPTTPAPAATSPDWKVSGGAVVALGPDAARLRAKWTKFLDALMKKNKDPGISRVQIAGHSWYRSKAEKSDDEVVTFGFHDDYFVVGVGPGAIEGILARWNAAPPAWLTKALEQTPVPRRTGIIYFNVRTICEKLLASDSAKEMKTNAAALGLNNVEALISTTGLDESGMINRVLMTLDGAPAGLVNLVSDRPLTAKDLAPIPREALAALAFRFDLHHVAEFVMSSARMADPESVDQLPKNVEMLKKQFGVDLQRFGAALGDCCCVYSAPTEGEVPFLGWTMVVPVRDARALREELAHLEKTGVVSQGPMPGELKKFHFAGQEVYYITFPGQVIAPAYCVTNHELVATLNLPAMKAYLQRRGHKSLAGAPLVARALADGKGPTVLGYCDTPRVFDIVYPLFSVYATVLASAGKEAGMQFDPAAWPSAPSIRTHLRPDVTTLSRTPRGLELTCRYSFPTGGVNLPMMYIAMSAMGMLRSSNATPTVLPPVTSSGPVTTPAPMPAYTAPVGTAPAYGTAVPAAGYSSPYPPPACSPYGASSGTATTLAPVYGSPSSVPAAGKAGAAPVYLPAKPTTTKKQPPSPPAR